MKKSIGLISARDRILLAWETDTQILPRITIMERAKTTDVHEFRHVADTGLIRRDGNEWGLTSIGVERRHARRALLSVVP